MSVIFFDVEELANVAMVLCDNPWARSEEPYYLKALAKFSEANARAFNVNYRTPRGDIETATPHSAALIKEWMDECRRTARPNVARACGTARLMSYNTIEADPTKEETEATLTIVSSLLSKAVDALEAAMPKTTRVAR